MKTHEKVFAGTFGAAIGCFAWAIIVGLLEKKLR